MQIECKTKSSDSFNRSKSPSQFFHKEIAFLALQHFILMMAKFKEACECEPSLHRWISAWQWWEPFKVSSNAGDNLRDRVLWWVTPMQKENYARGSGSWQARNLPEIIPPIKIQEDLQWKAGAEKKRSFQDLYTWKKRCIWLETMA